jgi:hypothetical protein
MSQLPPPFPGSWLSHSPPLLLGRRYLSLGDEAIALADPNQGKSHIDNSFKLRSTEPLSATKEPLFDPSDATHKVARPSALRARHASIGNLQWARWPPAEDRPRHQRSAAVPTRLRQGRPPPRSVNWRQDIPSPLHLDGKCPRPVTRIFWSNTQVRV